MAFIMRISIYSKNAQCALQLQSHKKTSILKTLTWTLQLQGNLDYGLKTDGNH